MLHQPWSPMSTDAKKDSRLTTKPDESILSKTTIKYSNHHASGGLLPRSRKKVYLPARLRWAAASIQAIVDATTLEDKSHSVAAASRNVRNNRIKITLSDSALHALALCHERFLQVLASELTTAGASNKAGADDQSQRATARSYVQVGDIVNSLETLGFSHLLKAAQGDAAAKHASRAVTQRPRKGKQNSSRRSRKRKEWSASEVEEQERLLARSKAKFEQSAATKKAS